MNYTDSGAASTTWAGDARWRSNFMGLGGLLPVKFPPDNNADPAPDIKFVRRRGLSPLDFLRKKASDGREMLFF